MYNRYIPGQDGIYRRQTVAEQTPSCPKQEPPQELCEEDKPIRQHRPPCRITSDGFDLGDLLLLCIVILLLIDSEEDDLLPLLITAAAFVFLQ